MTFDGSGMFDLCVFKIDLGDRIESMSKLNSQWANSEIGRDVSLEETQPLLYSLTQMSCSYAAMIRCTPISFHLPPSHIGT